MTHNNRTRRTDPSRQRSGFAQNARIDRSGPSASYTVSPLWIATVLVALAVFASPVAAQMADGSLMLPAEIDIRGKGWSQLSNYDEMVEFALSLIEVIAATALLAFHPVNFRYRDHASNFDLTKSMFLFAFIGMLTGFLVMNHGYLIGFVIFGIGGLFRFRMETINTFDTAQLVIVALVGLAVGLDLPVMAFVSVAATSLVLWIFGKTVTLHLEVKFDEKRANKDIVLAFERELTKRGFDTVAVSKAKFKAIGHFTLKSKKPGAQASLLRNMADLQSHDELGIEDWHID